MIVTLPASFSRLMSVGGGRRQVRQAGHANCSLAGDSPVVMLSLGVISVLQLLVVCLAFQEQQVAQETYITSLTTPSKMLDIKSLTTPSNMLDIKSLITPSNMLDINSLTTPSNTLARQFPALGFLTLAFSLLNSVLLVVQNVMVNNNNNISFYGMVKH